MTDAPLILAFDTSGPHCAAALMRGGTLLDQRAERMERGQAERLMPMIEEMLAGHGLGWRDIGLIGVGTGPGNFTGVRLSVSAARGLALPLKVPAIGVTSLEAAAFGLSRPVLAALDARRDEVYLQLFDEDAPNPVLASRDALPAWAFEAELIVGDAAAGLAPLLPDAAVALQPVPLAEAIACIALERSATPQPRPAPLYLRAADAAPPRDPAPELLP